MPFIDDEYVFDAVELDSEDEDYRRWAVIAISRCKIGGYDDKLLAMLTREPEQDLRRHIVRALGNLQSAGCVSVLLGMLDTEKGFILGEIAQALGKIGVQEARPKLEQLTQSRVEWAANQARFALKLLEQRD